MKRSEVTSRATKLFQDGKSTMTDKQPSPTKRPAEISSALNQLRTRIRCYVVVRGLALLVLAIGIAYWISLLIDYTPTGLGLTDLPAAVRFLMLLATLATCCFVAWRYLIQPLSARLTDTSMALLLERRFKDLGDSLLTSVELGDHAQVDGHGGQMLASTQEQAKQKLPSLPIGSVFRIQPLVFCLIGAGLFLVSWVLFALISPSNFWLSTQRLYLLSDVAWPRAVKLERMGVFVQRDYDLASIPKELDRRYFENGKLRVAKGTRLALIIQAEAPNDEIPNRRLPKLCTLRSRTEAGALSTHSISSDGPEIEGLQNYRYEGDPFIDINETLFLSVKGGDHRLPKHQIQVVEAPSIISTELDCQFPQYLVDPESGSWTPRKIQWPYPDALPAQTNVTLECQTNKPIQRVFVHRVTAGIDEMIEVSDSQNATSFRIPLGNLQESEIVEMALLDQDQVLSTNQFTIDVRVAEDQTPRIETTMQGIGSAVTPNVRIPLSGGMTDDYGIEDAWLEVQATGLDTFTVDVSRLPENQFEHTLDLLEERRKQTSELLLEANDEQRLVLKVKAQDKYNLNGGTHIGESDPISLRIVSESDLLAILNRAEVGQRQILEQIHREMQECQLQILQARVESESLEQSEPGADDGEVELRGVALNRLFALRAVRQAEKSQDELQGVYNAFVDIRLQLINNRIDAPQRLERLEKRVALPLAEIQSSSFPNLTQALDKLEEALGKLELNPTDQEQQLATNELANQSISLAQQVVDEIDAVLVQLLDIEDDSRLMEIVRQMIEDQEALLKETESERKKQGLRDLIGN